MKHFSLKEEQFDRNDQNLLAQHVKGTESSVHGTVFDFGTIDRDVGLFIEPNKAFHISFS